MNLDRIMEWAIAGVKTSWLQFTAFILVFGFAQMMGDTLREPIVIRPVQGEARCETLQAVFIPPEPPYQRKAVCPHTEPAYFLGVEVQTELWLVSGYAVGDPHTPGRNTADGWAEGLVREVRPGITVACSWELPLGTMVVIDKIGPRVCEDRGGGPDRRWIDVAFETVLAAEVWGQRWARVAIIRPEERE